MREIITVWAGRATMIIFSLWLAMVGAAIAQDRYVLTGTVLTPTQTIANGSVTVQSQKIAAVGPATSTRAGVKVIATGGIILPGLIDLHDHLSWNALPRWKPNSEFANHSIENRKIVHWRDYMDSLAAWRALNSSS